MLGFFSVVLATFFWASDVLVRVPLLSKLSHGTIIFYEHLFLTIIFLPFLLKLFKKTQFYSVKSLACFIWIGSLGSAIGLFAFTKAFSIMNPSLVILLQQFQPVVAICLAAIVLKEQLTAKFLLGAFVCLAGGLLMAHEHIEALLSDSQINASFEGYLYALGAAVIWGASTVFGKKIFLENFGQLEITSGRFFFGLLAMIPIIFWGESKLTVKLEDYRSLATIVLIGALGMVFYYQGLSRLRAKICTLAEMFYPLFGIALSWVYLDATLDIWQLTGGALLLTASLVIQWNRF